MAAPGKPPFDDTAFPLETEPPPLREVWLGMLTAHLSLIAAGIGVVVFIGAVAFDLMLLQRRETPIALVLSNGLAALLSAALVYTLLAYGRRQRRRVVERMEALNEVNHHIRNALQSLAFAAGSLKDRKEGDAITEAITRIQWALLEILPKVEPTFEPFEGSARNVVQRLQRPPQDPQNGVQ